MSMTYTTIPQFWGACYFHICWVNLLICAFPTVGSLSALAMPKDAAMVRMGINLGSPEEEAKVSTLSNSLG